MRRPLVPILCLLSLLLCAASAALWIRSQFRADTFGWAGWKNQPAGIWRGWGISSESGRLIAYSFSGTAQFDNPRSITGNVPTMTPHFVHESLATGNGPRPSFRWDHLRIGGTRVYSGIGIIGMPLWFTTFPFAIAPFWYGAQWLRRNRIKRV